jgi:hypothetical protein
MNELRLLGAVVLEVVLLIVVVPSGTMLQVIVAAVPLPPGRGPLAVESHGSGSLGVMMNARAGPGATNAPNPKSNRQ